MQFGITSVDVIPTLKCNLNCPFCYQKQWPHLREKILDVSVLDAFLLALKAEKSQVKTVTLYGGEVLLLPKSYLEEVLHLIKERLPQSRISAIVNLSYPIKGEVEKKVNLLLKEDVKTSTSYDLLRFPSKKVEDFWLENVRALNVTDVLLLLYKGTKVTTLQKLEEKVGRRLCFHVCQFTLSVNLPQDSLSKGLSFCLTFPEVKKFVSSCLKAGLSVEVPYNKGNYVFNAIHLLPSGEFGLPEAFDLEWPLERYAIFGKVDEKAKKVTINQSPSRVSYVKKCLSYLNSKCEACFLEYFRDDLCSRCGSSRQKKIVNVKDG